MDDKALQDIESTTDIEFNKIYEFVFKRQLIRGTQKAISAQGDIKSSINRVGDGQASTFNNISVSDRSGVKELQEKDMSKSLQNYETGPKAQNKGLNPFTQMDAGEAIKSTISTEEQIIKAVIIKYLKVDFFLTEVLQAEYSNLGTRLSQVYDRIHSH